MSEKEFIVSLQKGDPLAFKQLVETWQNRVYNTLLSIVQDIQEAEDLSQEVFIQVYQSVKSFRGDSKLSTWLYRISVTKALDAERKKKTKKRVANLKSWVGLGEKEESAIHFYHPGIQLENKEFASLLFLALQKLPENQRVAFTLIKAEGLTYVETAAIIKVSIKAVEALMHRAKESLRKYLQESQTIH